MDITQMKPFDLLAPLPTGACTTVLEASAGTGKTYALAALVTRYVAEGTARLDEMLLITFSRAATQELRERVRAQLVQAVRVLTHPAAAAEELAESTLLTHLLDAPADELGRRRERLGDALAGFDAATIATTHQFCQLVLRSLGVAGDSDAGVQLVESLDELVAEVVDDLYLRRFGQDQGTPAMTRAEALTMAGDVVGNPRARLTPDDVEPGTVAAVRVDFARSVLAELEHRKRRLGILGYDDLLGRLATALAEEDAPARARMRQRWRIVMVDEFQDTDPVQWEVVERAFVGVATVVLIGDPKQAIYAFRGGDISTYLRAARTAERQFTLSTNWRSDRALVTRLQALMLGAALGHDEIVVREVQAHHTGSRLQGAPCDDPFRLRVVTREKFGVRGERTVKMDPLRDHVTADLAADVVALLASGATYDARPLRAGDVAVIVEAHRDARACHAALAAAGVPAVYTGDSDVFGSDAAHHWLSLLEAFEAPHRSGLVRSVATTPFFGRSAADLDAGGEDLTDLVATTVREWADHLRERGVAAVFEAACVAGLAARVLAHRGGERELTDLAHVAQILHDKAHREHLGIPALLDWLRQQSDQGNRERNRRLDSDAAAVQIMTVWVSKGLQFPLVYLPFAFNRHVMAGDDVLHHDAGGQRCLDIGGKSAPGFKAVEALGRAEHAADDIRLTYVELTRAQSQVVAWWAPSWDEPNGGLSRLLRGRSPGESMVPDRCAKAPDDTAVVAGFRVWQAAGGPTVEESVVVTSAEPPPPVAPAGLGVRAFRRPIDTTWRRTSYSGLVRSAEQTRGVTSEPEAEALSDEVPDEALGAGPGEPEAAPPAEEPEAILSPMADLPSGATLGSLVHAVLEKADPKACDLHTELASRIADELVWWPVDATIEELATALVPLHHTPLGPLAGDVTLADVPLGDRLCELDFEIPLAGGDRFRPEDAPEPRLADVGRLLEAHLADDDPVRPYAQRLLAPGLREQSLRGYLSGSIDAVLRLAGPDGPRYLVADYKTNRLGQPGRPLRAADYGREQVTAAMLHSDYPLQALLYVAVVHRYLRWRQPGYDPQVHLGGVLYLYVRGMCGAATPLDDGHPAGVFSWRPPAALVEELSDLLDGRLHLTVGGAS